MREHAPDPPRLVERLRAGDRDAFEQLVRGYQHRVFGVAVRMLGNAAEAVPWLDHIDKVFGEDDGRHIITWLAQRVQRPAVKINHALVLGGPQGIGKDTLLEPVNGAL